MYTKLYPILFGSIYVYIHITNNYVRQNNIQNIQSIQSKWIYLRR